MKKREEAPARSPAKHCRQDIGSSTDPGGMVVFALLVVAVIFRKGICPAHAWVADAMESGPAIPTALLLNGHFGALLVTKLIVPLFPHTARNLDAGKRQHVVATGGNGADFIIFMRKDDCFEYSSVEISNSHNYIVRPWLSANQSFALHVGQRTIL